MNWPFKKKEAETLEEMIEEHFRYVELDMLLEAGQLHNAPNYQHIWNCKECRGKLEAVLEGRKLIQE